MARDTTERNEHISYRLDGDRVVQRMPGGDESRFDPKDWGAFRRGSWVVRATQIPKPFRVGGDVCTDGYLVFDGQRLYAMSTAGFQRSWDVGFDADVVEEATAAGLR